MRISHHNHEKSGFTLIEILVVMAIIGVLAGLLFPGVSAAMNSAKKADAGNTAYQLRTAVTSYFTEYRKQPVPGRSSGGNDEYLDFATDEPLMDILLGAKDNERNPRAITFYSGRTAKRVGGGNYIKGVALNADGGGSLWDAYGRMYGIRLDMTNRERMSNPEINQPQLSGGVGAPQWGSGSSSNNVPDLIAQSVAVWSSGKELEKSKDNIKTW